MGVLFGSGLAAVSLQSRSCGRPEVRALAQDERPLGAWQAPLQPDLNISEYEMWSHPRPGSSTDRRMWSHLSVGSSWVEKNVVTVSSAVERRRAPRHSPRPGDRDHGCGAIAITGDLATPGSGIPVAPGRDGQIDPCQMKAVSGGGVVIEAGFRRHRHNGLPMLEQAIIGPLARSFSLPFRPIAARRRL